MPARVLVEVDGVTCAFGAEPVLDGVTLRVAPGEVVAVVGPNGAGKTSLIKVLSGLLLPRRGCARLDGREVASLPPAERARALGVVPSEGRRDLAFTVEEAVALGRLPHLHPLAGLTAADREAVRRALAAAGLSRLAGRPLHSLSGGEAQRVWLARALAQEPRVLLLDEPTAHLDLGHQAAFLALLGELARSRPLAAVAVLHDLNQAALWSDRVVLLARGRVVAAGAPEDVLTPERIAAVYGVDVLVQPHPRSGRPQVVFAEGGVRPCPSPAS